MYNCAICGRTSQPREQRLVHRVYYEKGEQTGNIKQEYGVCGSCDAAMKDGTSKEEINDHHVKKQEQLRLKATPLCDVCYEPVFEGGQVTADTVLCEKHLPRPQRRSNRRDKK